MVSMEHARHHLIFQVVFAAVVALLLFLAAVILIVLSPATTPSAQSPSNSARRVRDHFSLARRPIAAPSGCNAGRMMLSTCSNSVGFSRVRRAQLRSLRPHVDPRRVCDERNVSDALMAEQIPCPSGYATIVPRWTVVPNRREQALELSRQIGGGIAGGLPRFRSDVLQSRVRYHRNVAELRDARQLAMELGAVSSTT
jgi:hypothetical protein